VQVSDSIDGNQPPRSIAAKSLARSDRSARVFLSARKWAEHQLN
jgi:hypothetical protein